MRRRLIALLLAVAGSLGGLLVAAAPASAATPMCHSESHKRLTKIVCETPSYPFELVTVVWHVDGNHVANYDGRIEIGFYCELGRTYLIHNTQLFVGGTTIRTQQRVGCFFNPR